MAKNDNLDDIVIPDLNKQVDNHNESEQRANKDIYAQINAGSKPSKSEQKKKPRDRRITSLILSIVFFIMGVLFAVATVLVFYKLYFATNTGNKELDGFLTVLFFIITYGLITYVPAFIFAIVGIIMSSVGAGSDSTPQKVISRIFLILNILLLLALIIMFILGGSLAVGPAV